MFQEQLTLYLERTLYLSGWLDYILNETKLRQNNNCWWIEFDWYTSREYSQRAGQFHHDSMGFTRGFGLCFSNDHASTAEYLYLPPHEIINNEQLGKNIEQCFPTIFSMSPNDIVSYCCRCIFKDSPYVKKEIENYLVDCKEKAQKYLNLSNQDISQLHEKLLKDNKNSINWIKFIWGHEQLKNLYDNINVQKHLFSNKLNAGMTYIIPDLITLHATPLPRRGDIDKLVNYFKQKKKKLVKN
tara:strand:- start:2161 stop:2886 length:726 start_codon:yes stop_codon:yes gene_type:complete